MAKFLRYAKGIGQQSNLIWVTVTMEMTKTLLLWAVTIMQQRVKVMFGQDHNTLDWILVVSNLLLEVPVNRGYRSHLMWTKILPPLPSFSSSSWSNPADGGSRDQ
jgi:hypothetical protein